MLTDFSIIEKYKMTKNNLRTINQVCSLLTDQDFITANITSQQCSKFRGDFSGLLNELNVPIILHPFIMNYNGIKSSDLFITDIYEIKLISPKKIKKILDYTLG